MAARFAMWALLCAFLSHVGAVYCQEPDSGTGPAESPETTTSEATPGLPGHLYLAVLRSQRDYESATTEEARAYSRLLLTNKGLEWLNAQSAMVAAAKVKAEYEAQAIKHCVGETNAFEFDAKSVSCVKRVSGTSAFSRALTARGK